MRTGGEDEREAQNLTAIITDLELLAIWERDGEIRRGPGNFSGPHESGRQDECCDCECAHMENLSIQGHHCWLEGFVQNAWSCWAKACETCDIAGSMAYTA